MFKSAFAAILICASISVGAYLDTAQITATASSEFPYSPGGVASSTIDKSGLDTATLLLHDSDYHNNWHTQAGSQPTWIKYEFDQPYALGVMWVWNMNQAGCNTRGIKDNTIEYSQDGVNWTSLGQYRFAIAPGADGYAHNTEINFYGISARYVRINAINSWGDSYWGLAEVRFNLADSFAAKNPNPFPGKTVDNVSQLSWVAGQSALSHNVYFGTSAQDVNSATTSTPSIFKGNQAGTTFNPGTLQNGMTYYWRIDEVTGSQTYKGSVWNFTVAQESAYNPTPANGATKVDVNSLSWTAGNAAVSHNVYVGTNYSSVLAATPSTIGIYKANQTATTYPITLDLGKTYYWRVDEVKSGGAVVTGTVWSFTTQPDNIILSKNITSTGSSIYFQGQDFSRTTDLSGMTGDMHNNDWLSMWMTAYGDYAPWYIMYQFDKPYLLNQMWVWNYNHTITRGIKKCYLEYSADSTDGSDGTWTRLGGPSYWFQFAQATGSAMLQHGNEVNFGGALAKYVRITTSSDADATWGDTSFCGLSEVRFYIPSAYASTPSPANGSRYIDQSVTLNWAAGGMASSHNVYLGTSYNSVDSATTASPEFKGNRTVTNYLASGLTVGQTYYWRIDEVNGSEVAKGYVWSFTVRPWTIAPGIASPLYVALSGNDNNNGSINSPFATLIRAKYAVRALIAAGLTADVHVYLRGGTYYLDETMTLDNTDSPGSTYKVYYEAYQGENPVISGGKRITGWTSIGSDKWQTTISDVTSGSWYFRQLWADGSRCQRAKWPNDKDSRFIVTSVSADLNTVGINQAVQGTNLASSETELVLCHSWSSGRARIASNTSSSVTTSTVCGAIGLSLTQPTAGGLNPDGLTTYADRGFLENNLDYIDQAGEWYLNRATGVLTYKAASGANPNNMVFVAPKLSILLTIDGVKGNTVKNIIFKGISFQNAGWDLPASGFGGHQGGHFGPVLSTSPTYVVPAALVLTYANNCVFNNCYVANLGASGISISAGCNDSKIINSKLYDIGGIGVIVGNRADKSGLLPALTYTDWTDTNDAPQRTIVSNNQLKFMGAEWFDCVGVLEQCAKFSQINNNIISDQPYTGISSGWSITGQPYSQQGVTISQNHIYNVCNILCDGGGIYTLGDHQSGLISGNFIHDIIAGTYGPGSNAAVYTDGGAPVQSKNITIQNSLTYNITNNNSYADNSHDPSITLINNYWNMIPSAWNSTQQAIAAAAGVLPVAPTLTLTMSADCGIVIVTGSCEPWSQISTAKISQTNTDIKSYLTVDKNGAIYGVVPASLISSATVSIQVVVSDPEGQLSTPATSNAVSPVPGDMNCDRKVNMSDMIVIASNWLNDTSVSGSCTLRPSGDLNGDCKVNLLDFAVLGLHWMEVH